MSLNVLDHLSCFYVMLVTSVCVCVCVCVCVIIMIITVY